MGFLGKLFGIKEKESLDQGLILRVPSIVSEIRV